MLATLALAAATCVAAPLPEPAGGWAVASPLLAAQQPHQATPLSRPPPCSAYAPLDGEANYGIGAEEGWLRLRLPPTLDEPRLLLRFAGLEQVCVYWPRRQAAPLRDCRQRATPAGLGGSDIGWLLRPPADFDPAGEIQLGAIAPLWLKLPLEYGSAEGLARASHRRQYYWGLYYGLLLASAVMGLVTFAAQREKMYLIFAAHVGALGVAVALWQGRFVAWEFAGISSVGLAPMLMGLAVAAGALFHRDFMATARTAPRASRGFGPVGFELAAALRGRVRSITLLNTLLAVSRFRKPWVMRPFEVPLLGEAWLASMVKPAFRLLMAWQGIGDVRAVPPSEIDAHVALLKHGDGGRAFLRIMRSFETTAEKEARYISTVRNVPYPVQLLWGAQDPALRLDVYGRIAADITGAPLHTVPGKHFLQEDQAPAIADAVARIASQGERQAG